VRILALDTATEACSVALLTDAGVIGRYREVGRGHAEEILGMVDAVLAQAGIGLTALDAIAASVGPGAFTGVRICVSVAQGLAFGAGLPVIPVTTLEALALRAVRDSGAAQVLACLDARMGEVYWACFRADPTGGLAALGSAAVGAAASVAVPFAGSYYGIGRGFAAYPALGARPRLILADGADDALPDARQMAELGALRFAAGEALDPGDLTPRYLRDKVAQTEIERAQARAATTRPMTDL
jgi:tRNA threonylcarbamoyladenosine biosynthesis protein TsaB